MKALFFRKILYSAVILLSAILILSPDAGISCAGVDANNEPVKLEVAHAFLTYALDNFLDPDGIRVSVTPRSTSEVYRDILDGTADMIIATAPSEEQKRFIEESDVKLKFTELFKEPLAILVNTENPVNNLTVSDIRDIYCSESPCWSDYADYDRPANTYQLEENNGSQTAFRNIVDGNELGEHHREVQGMQEIIDCVADDPGGICYAFLMYFQKRHNRDECRTVKVNGFDVDSPEYPLQYEVFLISREDNDDVRVKALSKKCPKFLLRIACSKCNI